MVTLTYVFPFDHEPTIEEMAGHDLLIVDAGFESAETAVVRHSLNCVAGTDPVVSVTPLHLVAFAIGDISANSVEVSSGGSGWVRLYFSRLR